MTEIISSISYSVNGTSCDEVVTTIYQYDELSGLLSYENIETLNYAALLEYEYDSFDRLSSVEYILVDSSTNTAVTKTEEYSYYELDDLSTSYRVSEYNSTIGDDEYGYIFTYDSDGNIIGINYSNGDSVTYTYDDLGQLIRENYELANKNYEYTYDNAGNITSIKKIIINESLDDDFIQLRATYPLGSKITTVNLEYTDSQWGDLLTKYDGTTITYDQIGNPLSYYNGTPYILIILF